MWTPVALALLSTIPSPGGHLLDVTGPVALTAELLAQVVPAQAAPTPGATTQGKEEPTKNPEEQKKLTDDMDAARKKLGQPDGQTPTTPAPTEGQALDQDMDRAKEHLGHDHAHDPAHPHDHDHAQSGAAGGDDAGDVDSYDDDERGPRVDKGRKDKRKKKMHGRKPRLKARPDWYDAPTYEGHGRGYYRLWGIVDWGFAGVAYGGHLLTAGLAIASLVVAGQNGPLSADQQNPGEIFDQNAPDFDDRRFTKRTYREGGITLGLTSAALLVSGLLLSWRGQTNIGIANDLTEQEGAELQLYRARREIKED